MKHYEIEINIAASADVVWRVLTQVMPQNPMPFGILRLDGKITQGAKIKLVSEVAPKRVFTLRVATFQAPYKMVWRGGIPLGLFTGTRTFTLAPHNAGTGFHMHEAFHGPLAGLITNSMPDMNPSFAKFAQALKTKAETI